MDLRTILDIAHERDASDIHLVTDHPPMVRLHTVMTSIGDEPITEEEGWALLREMAPEGAMKRFGLVLVTGDTGSGKSTTLAAMIQAMNERYRKHIITLEDPVEYTFESDQCLIEQRELGRTCPRFASALKHALRQDPDIVLVGEMRDLETTALAITAAETGHLVLSTLHTVNASQTVERIIDMYPANQQNQIRSMLANTLQAVISQTLFSRIDEPGMVPAVETLLCTPAVRNLIRENRTFEIPNVIETNRARSGMSRWTRRSRSCTSTGMISKEDAIAQAASPDKLERQTSWREERGAPLTEPLRRRLMPNSLPDGREGQIRSDDLVGRRAAVRGDHRCATRACTVLRNRSEPCWRPAGSVGAAEAQAAQLRASPSQKHVLDFTTQLAVMIRAGISLRAALDGIAEQTEHRGSSRLIVSSSGRGVRQAVLRGARSAPEALRPAVREHGPGVGDVRLVRQMLDRIAAYLAQQIETRKMVIGAMIYPGVIAFMAMG